MMENVLAIMDKIIPLISTLLGAGIAYFTGIFSKKNDIKIKSKIKARDDFWIPCCLKIEALQNRILELDDNGKALVSFYGDNSCEPEISKVLSYLQANNRIYFYKRTRGLLNSLEKNVRDYETILNNDVKFLFDDFVKKYSDLIKKASVYKNENCKDVNFLVENSLLAEIKKALLRKENIDWMGKVKAIHFYKEDAPIGDDFFAELEYENGNFYEDVWLQIREFNIDESIFELSSEQKLGLEILDFEYKNIDTIGDELNKLIQTKNYQNEYVRIFETMNMLRKELLSNIDSATFL